MADLDESREEDIFHILIATDIHLGYAENNPIRENDTFATFEEILQIAVREDVDFILLGGDLFHETRPTPYCINKCTELIRRYCFGDKPVRIEFLSDPSYNFRYTTNPTVNYEDPNMNVSVPIFSIHGNHDDPTGKKQISAMDLMASMGLINYFGRWDDLSKVDVYPVLLRKGESQLALYGLSHIRDERLARLFLEQKVALKTPENENEWFNLMILHQNRANRGVKNFIAESLIPNFIDLVMWGHEHDCKIEPLLTHDDIYITQPGSSVATSLAEGESIPKKVGLLRVNKKRFNINAIELHTVRPFIYKQINLKPPEGSGIKVTHAERAMEKVKLTVQEMINQAKNLGRKADLLPLIRLLIKYEDERQVFNAIRFGQLYAGEVANPEDMIKFASVQKIQQRSRLVGQNGNLDDEDEVDGEEVNRVEDLIPKYFNEANQMTVLSLNGLNEAVRRFIDSNDSEALPYLINHQSEETLKQLKERRPSESEVDDVLIQLRDARTGSIDEFRKMLDAPRPSKSNRTVDLTIGDSDDDSSASTSSTTTPVRGRGSRGGRGPRGSRGSRATRGKAKT